MHRRRLLALAGLFPCTFLPGSCAALRSSPDRNEWQDSLHRHRCAGARLGVAVLDTRSGAVRGWNEDDRFPLCSTFKAPLAAAVLARIDAGREQAGRRIAIRRSDLLPYSPVTEAKAGSSLTVEELCAAAVTFSDNAAANLLLATLGGPAGLTDQLRRWGDTETRLDRQEPDLNESRPGDPRDTTTPGAMVRLLDRILLRDALSPGSRKRLLGWMRATTTNRNRLAAGLPPGWSVASKTGTGSNGSTNDAGILFPPEWPPVAVAIYLTETDAPLAAREAVLADVARSVIRSAGG